LSIDLWSWSLRLCLILIQCLLVLSTVIGRSPFRCWDWELRALRGSVEHN
jgi:hypothetical protein